MAYNKSEWWDHWICADCGMELLDESLYMLRNDLWLAVMGSPEGHLCPFCLEVRLGRELETEDFTDCLLNEAVLLRLAWGRRQGHAALMAESRRRRDRLDRRAARRRKLKAERRQQSEESVSQENSDHS